MTNNRTPDLEAALNCTIEHLDGEHEGKIVVDREVFETLYEAAASRLRPAVPREVIEKVYGALKYVADDLGDMPMTTCDEALAALKPYVEE